MLTALLVLTVLAQAPREVPPKYRYEVVPPPVPVGSTLYAHAGERPVMVASDVFAFRELQQTVRAQDAKGYEDLIDSGRAFLLEPGTELRVLRFEQTITTDPAYETRVMDGKQRDKKAWVFAGFARRRVPDVPEKAKAKRKRR